MRVFPAISSLLICFIGLEKVMAVEFASCNSDIDAQVQQFQTMRYGSLNTFYTINKKIADGLQKSMSDNTLENIYNFIYNKQGSIGTVINDVVSSQAGAIAFFCVGLLLIVVSLVLGIAICSCRCCCNSCGADKEDVTYPSLAGVIAMVVSLVTAFAFVITGVIIFNISANNLYSAVDDSPGWINTVVNDLNNVVTNGTGDMTCAVNLSLDATFSTIEAQMGNFSTNLYDQFMDDTGLGDLDTYDFDGLVKSINQAQTDSAAAKTAVDLLTCQPAKDTALGNLNSIDGDLTNDLTVAQGAKLAQTTVNAQIQQQFLTLNSSINGPINTAIQQMTTTQNQINKQMANIQLNVVNQTMQTIQNLQNAINTAQHDITTWSGYKPVRASWQAAMSVPNCICLFFSLFTGIALILWIFKGNNTPKGLGYFAIFGFYFVIFLAWMAMAVASVTFIGGWAISGTCKPMFEDKSFRVYGLVNLNFTIQGFQGHSSTVTPQQLLQRCYAQETMFRAIGGDSLISPQMVLDQLNLNSSKVLLDTVISGTNLDFTFDQDGQLLTKISAATKSLSDDKKFFDAGNFLPNCKGADDARAKLATLTKSLDDVYARLLSLNTTVAKVDQNQDNSKEQQQNLLDFTNGQFDGATNTVNASVTQLINQLDTSTFPCYPLYLSFQNAGTIVCDWFGGPIHGMWGAAGLAAIFFIPVAIILLWAARTLFTGHREKSFEAKDERFDVQPVAVHRSKTAQDPLHDGVFAMPPIRSDQSEGLPRANANYYANQPTAHAAAPWLDDSYSKGSGLPRTDEGLQRRDPYDDYDTKSTGLRRTDPESSRPGLFGNDDRWGSVSASGSGSGLRRNYDPEEVDAPQEKWSSTALRRL